MREHLENTVIDNDFVTLHHSHSNMGNSFRTFDYLDNLIKYKELGAEEDMDIETLYTGEDIDSLKQSFLGRIGIALTNTLEAFKGGIKDLSLEDLTNFYIRGSKIKLLTSNEKYELSHVDMVNKINLDISKLIKQAMIDNTINSESDNPNYILMSYKTYTMLCDRNIINIMSHDEHKVNELSPTNELYDCDVYILDDIVNNMDDIIYITNTKLNLNISDIDIHFECDAHVEKKGFLYNQTFFEYEIHNCEKLKIY